MKDNVRSIVREINDATFVRRLAHAKKGDTLGLKIKVGPLDEGHVSCFAMLISLDADGLELGQESFERIRAVSAAELVCTEQCLLNVTVDDGFDYAFLKDFVEDGTITEVTLSC